MGADPVKYAKRSLGEMRLLANSSQNLGCGQNVSNVCCRSTTVDMPFSRVPRFSPMTDEDYEALRQYFQHPRKVREEYCAPPTSQAASAYGKAMIKTVKK